jgi:hypothetical protein
MDPKYSVKIKISNYHDFIEILPLYYLKQISVSFIGIKSKVDRIVSREGGVNLDRIVPKWGKNNLIEFSVGKNLNSG